MSSGSPRRITGDDDHESDLPSDLPSDLAGPARRALAAAGYPYLDQLAGVSEAELLRLHRMGPRAVEALRRALSASRTEAPPRRRWGCPSSARGPVAQ